MCEVKRVELRDTKQKVPFFLNCGEQTESNIVLTVTHSASSCCETRPSGKLSAEVLYPEKSSAFGAVERTHGGCFGSASGCNMQQETRSLCFTLCPFLCMILEFWLSSLSKRGKRTLEAKTLNQETKHGNLTEIQFRLAKKRNFTKTSREIEKWTGIERVECLFYIINVKRTLFGTIILNSLEEGH